MTRRPPINLKTVRKLRSGMRHRALVDETKITIEEFYSGKYRQPSMDTVSLCGVKLDWAVVVQQGVPVNCKACLHVEHFWLPLVPVELPLLVGSVTVDAQA